MAPYYAVQPVLLPFQDLMKQNMKFYWDEVLQKLFEKSREVIADEVLKGIYSFEVGSWTGVLLTGAGVALVMSWHRSTVSARR